MDLIFILEFYTKLLEYAIITNELYEHFKKHNDEYITVDNKKQKVS